jgi:hypothetical protein
MNGIGDEERRREGSADQQNRRATDLAIENSRKASIKSREVMDELEERLEEVGIVKPPDGGYGWVVVFASFCSNAIVDGIIFTGQILEEK